jgi:hypothetical protein
LEQTGVAQWPQGSRSGYEFEITNLFPVKWS